ncbi:MAG: class I SAM-dependent methyltransferase [Bacteroidales bacterium]|nr:class I SAM-dependent methyltransferase [Bacteroidales bacterium]
MENSYKDINKKMWNNITDLNFESDFYDVESFRKGKSSLKPIELQLLGDVTGKKILHLQCHFGMDSISLSKMGANVTGVDISDKAIDKAKALAKEMNVDTRFICSDVLSLKEVLTDSFDIVFTSYGVITWLPDLNKWASLIEYYLRPRGKFILVEFHPVVWMFNDNFTSIDYSYFNQGGLIIEETGSYAKDDESVKNKSISWNHSISNVIQSINNTNQPVGQNGLSIISFEEYDYSPYNCFNNTVEIDEDKFQIDNLEGKIPMIFSLLATKENNGWKV